MPRRPVWEGRGGEAGEDAARMSGRVHDGPPTTAARCTPPPRLAAADARHAAAAAAMRERW